MPDQIKLLAPRDVAERLSVSTRTLINWRKEKGRGPAFISIGNGSVRYKETDVETWIENQRSL